MKKLFASILIAAGLMVGASGVMTLAVAEPAHAQLSKGMNPTKNGTDLRGRSVEGLIKSVVNVLLFIIGAVSVVMIIVGGIQYTVSAGDAGRAKTAKNTILYAIVGVVIAIFAYAIVNFVVGRVK